MAANDDTAPVRPLLSTSRVSGHIKSPCLATALEHDCWFPPRAVREAAKRIPSCQYTELPGLGHGAPLLAADQVNPILAEFLD
jgi:pimeloyl-ACP methyl ester carboxylesterase